MNNLQFKDAIKEEINNSGDLDKTAKKINLHIHI